MHLPLTSRFRPSGPRGRGARQHVRRAAAVLLMVLVLGLFSNAFVGMVLSLPLWMLVADRGYRKNRWNYLVPVLGMALVLYFYVRLSDQQTGAYATSFSIGTFWKNATYYFKGDVGASLWIAVVVGGAAYSWRKGRLLCAWFFMASAAFMLPFAFLEHQRYGSYSVLTHLFFLLGCATARACPVRGCLHPGPGAGAVAGAADPPLRPVPQRQDGA